MIADQMELFCIAFFQLPMFRRLEGDMIEITENEVNMEAQKKHAAELRLLWNTYRYTFPYGITGALQWVPFPFSLKRTIALKIFFYFSPLILANT